MFSVCAACALARVGHVLLLFALRIFSSLMSSILPGGLRKCMQFVRWMRSILCVDWYDECGTKSKYERTIYPILWCIRMQELCYVRTYVFATGSFENGTTQNDLVSYKYTIHIIHASNTMQTIQHVLHHYFRITIVKVFHSNIYAGNSKIGKTNRWKLENNRAKWNCIFDLA